MSRIAGKLGNSGFTLIELVIIIVVLGIIAAIAVPKYQNIAIEAKESSCKGALGALRSGINIWYANQAAMGNTPTYPSIDSLSTIGVVMEQALPTNPYQSNAADSIVTGVTKATIVGTRGGWAYKAATGEVWPNTNTVGENVW
ncbi:MAG: prepilin-type N-terminal cleavage/methylation domain-containing protein [candidate division Zixibacteria bacterium]|nr:prepilin-type N-terminal cleavage/methylation domain-containing protein [candidate division Zixibacteria bacterium]MBU1469724.1 prepilin-type N-terminal cleavage/methylation domain-containing protein [candidate division Zixibacteria bacterium]MBU2625226.1 prepilin-type N-terminal cleavage/methylation domain-containing protein [candidate division Zixibacteria bacterium]